MHGDTGIEDLPDVSCWRQPCDILNLSTEFPADSTDAQEPMQLIWASLALSRDQTAAHALHSASRRLRTQTSGFITRRIALWERLALGQFVSTWPREATLITLEVPMSIMLAGML